MKLTTRALTIIVRPDGIVEILNNENWNDADTIEIAQENIAMLKKAVDGQPRAMLSHMPSTYMSKEVLECYENAEIGEIASALLTTSFGSKVVGNLFLKLTGKAATKSVEGKAPVKIFTKKEDAEAWLLEQIANHTN
ncbi:MULTISPECIES: hypothetical protein [unclassified Aureispira]|uniref:hypothetical protein n=1 Tax=unclassified Aureispira TaxID=2649989 RepID=UPI00069616D0|nr:MULTISPECIES: hypothetical protein [unclassified Aureispira]WMX12897.1 hypothetical protein QP953_18840 [Aureispira sp. CCB-E]